MCGRYSLHSIDEVLAAHFPVKKSCARAPRFNIAPSQPIAILRGDHEMVLMRWGLIPAWAKDPGIGNRMINARAETVSDKPAFREALARRRCLIPADGYYEWQREDRLGRRKQPFYIRLRENRPFAFAGLWERWMGTDGTALETCAILTTEPAESLRTIHDRMPAILDPKDYEQWLDSSVRQAALLQSLLRPYRADALTAYPVSLRVNDPAFDCPACLDSI